MPVQAFVTAAGRQIFKSATGRFISKQTYLRELRRGPGGRFITKARQVGKLTKSGLAQQLMEELGPPIGGGNWDARVNKSGPRFADMLSGR